jgi:peptidyl-prolyl cis-trans isomerase SurA
MKKIPLLILVSIICSVCWAQISDRIVAIVNDDAITQSELDRLLSLVYLELASTYDPPQLTAELEKAKDKILERLIRDRLVLQAARSQGIEASQIEIDARLKQLISNFESEEEFLQNIYQQGLSLEDLRSRIRDTILIEKVIDKEIKSRIVIDPADITSYYERHIEKFRLPEMMEVSYLLVRINDDSKEDRLRSFTEQLRQEIQGGAELEELARRYPQVDYRNLGKIEKGHLVEHLDKAVSELKPGECSKVLKTKLGFQILKLINKFPSRIQKLEEVQAGIQNQLFIQRFNQRLDSWIKKLKEDAYISIK